MTDPTLCITWSMPNARGCTTRMHLAGCEDGACEGCEPREAVNGLLCIKCWERLESTWDDWIKFLQMFRGVLRAVTPAVNRRPVPGPRLPLSPLQLDVDTVDRLAPDRHLETWVHTVAGATTGIEFTRTARHVMRKHPSREAVSEIAKSRCGKCKQRTLVYEPPQGEGLDAIVRCLNYGCGNVMDHTSFERFALIEAQCCRRCRNENATEACADTGCTCHRFAPVPEWQRTKRGEFEPFDVRKHPEHAELDPLDLLTVTELRGRARELDVPAVSRLRKAELVAAIREQEAA